MLNMIHQQSALKSLNVNRTGVAGLKVSTLKLGTTAKTSNVLGLIRGDSTPATNIKVDFTLSKSNNTPATDTATTATDYTPATGDDTTTPNVTPKQIINSGILNFGNAASEQANKVLSLLNDTTGKAKNITVETADDTDGEFVTSVTIKNGDGTTTTLDTTDGKVATVGTPETVADIKKRMEFDTNAPANVTRETLDTTGKADITRETLDTLTTNNTAPDGKKPLVVTDVEPVIINLDVYNFTTTTDDTNATTNINLPSTLAEKSQKLNDLANGDGNWGGNYQSDLLNDKDSDTFTGTTSLPEMDLDSITQPSSAGAMTEFQTEMNKQSEQPAWLASAKAMQEQANQQPQGVLQLLQ